ncbi:MAG: FAD binding domain-containing protein, partial [Myxococcota bacterium]
LCRHNQLADHDLMKKSYPLVAEAGHLVADPLIRNLGSIGGSLCHADPQADWGSVLLAMNGKVVLQKKGTKREMLVDDFLHGIFSTALDDDELLTELRVPKPTGKSGGAYLKLERKVGDFATAAVAVQVEMDGANIKQAGIGVTAMGPRNLKAVDAEKLLAGQAPSPELFADAAEAVANICKPKTDNRGSVDYKLGVVRTYVERGLERAVAFATSN